ncbi:TPA: alpha/beta fold hydrolase [Klebsiella pneumoniae]|uniref:alpha/beta fold hydrolase n=1 Tax=Gammaproteobacteria TaxID=1236 RepID=UPI001680CDC3|nr:MULTISPECIES: alpha/beta fold hydrolase [Gammaproteobacteria]HBT5887491.1 alpha/beta fold hydrolase [Klebsiella quasipneumoniae]HCI6318586.1 alpha/beta fold hydrolase [Klebsiella quasipneumoniae subsp. similipneumoniae]MBN9706742.1 alpha/beta fold hydrolase [Enterobacter roggenkampii]HBN8507767.1 alpha/beta fold hydrolase [Pseudomonas aeruginosa]HBR5509841.1 alpha/beta fold hydrolase [Klebsiella pneumoniae]
MACGDKISVEVAYHTEGKLNADGSNAILLTHGYTSSHNFAFSDTQASEGSWRNLVGPGKAIDTELYYVICSNALGSCYGTTGPSSLNPKTGQSYGTDFPKITFVDIVNVQEQLLSSLGVLTLQAIIGVSMGGFQALQWAVSFPKKVKNIFVALSSIKGIKRPGSLAEVLKAADGWNCGRPQPGALTAVLKNLREKTLLEYGLKQWALDQGQSEEESINYIRCLAGRWAAEFDPNSLLVLRQAIESFDVSEKLNEIRARTMFMFSTTDKLFPPSLSQEIERRARTAGLQSEIFILESRYGHLASGLDWKKWELKLKKFLEPIKDSQINARNAQFF